jgi:hypothetical protein
MGDLDDYWGDMSRETTSEIEMERLLSGEAISNDDPVPLAGFFAALRSTDDLPEETVARFVTVATEASQTAPRAAAATHRSKSWNSFGTLRRRVAAVTVTATVLVGGTTGLALAADGAKPGDALYGIDRALEAVGIGSGGEQERWREVEDLVESGEIERGLQHAAETVADGVSDDSEASEALRDAADRVQVAGSETSEATLEGVANLLTYVAENRGEIDGKQVAELATSIGGPQDHTATPSTGSAERPGPPDGVPANPPGITDRDPGPPDGRPASPPGLSDHEPGPPDGVPANPPGHSDSKPGPPDKDK